MSAISVTTRLARIIAASLLITISICFAFLAQSANAYADELMAGAVSAQAADNEITEDMVTVTAVESPTSPGTMVIDQASSVTVKKDSTDLVQDTDFVVEVNNNKPYSGVYKVKVTGKGLYTGSVEMYYKIEGNNAAKKKLLDSNAISLDNDGFEYDGQVHKPVITVKDGDTVLEEGKGYTVSFNNDSSMGLGVYYVYIYGAGDYIFNSSSVYKTYRIGTSLEDATITVKDKTYTGSAISFSSGDIEVKLKNGKVLNYSGNSGSSSEFTATSTDINVGEGTVVIKGIGTGDNTYVGSVEKKFKILPYDISSATVYASVSSQTYTGAALKPTPTSVYGYVPNYTVLKQGTDYELVYSNNVNAGTATLIVRGKGNYTGDNKKTFTINPAYISSATCNSISDKVYNGKQIKPSVRNVKFGNQLLKEGTDYTVSYGTNTSAGTGTVYLTGKGNFSSSSYYRKSVSFKINPKKINSAEISVSGIGNQAYTGSAHTPTVSVTDNAVGKTLLQMSADYISLYTAYGINYGNDYYVEYSNNTNPGTATVKLTGVGNYTGTRTVTFSIAGTGTVPKVTAVNKGNGTVKLSWGLIYGATKFMVQEKMPNGSYKTLSDNWQLYQCSIGNLSTTRKHRFLVRAFVNGQWSSASDSHLVSIKPTGASKPKLRAVSKSKTAVTLSWNAVPGADRYAIYEKVGGSFQLLTSSFTGTSATINKLSKKGKYTFYVRAYVDKKWTKATKKDRVTISPADPNPPKVTAVGGVGKGKVKLTWGKTRNAKKYKVQVRLANGKWKTLSKGTKKTTYTAKGLDPSRSHTFRVRAYGNKKWSKVYSDHYATATPDNA